MESVDRYITAVKKLAKAIGAQGVQLRYAIQWGLSTDPGSCNPVTNDNG